MGTVETFDFNFPLKAVDKIIHLYLPEGVGPFPVMYMYDGHNLFFDSWATYGTSWGLKDFMDQQAQPMIIVGIECSHEGSERLWEYSPYYIEKGLYGSGPIDGYGKEYMEWLVKDLKPFIDNKYPTLKEREYTAIAGSSMGGLMAFYSGLAHNDTFSKIVCLSPSLMFTRNDLVNELQNANIDTNSRFYFSFGEKEVENYPKALKAVEYFQQALDEVGAITTVHIEEDGEHNEATWALQTRRYFDFLFEE